MKQTSKRLPAAILARTPSKKAPRPTATFMDHIAELRRRLMWIALVFISGSALAYTYHQQLLNVIMSPLNGQKLVYLTPGGGFSFIFQVSIYAGLIIAAPFIVYHIYSFIRPALPDRAQRSAGKVVLAALALIVVGIAYGYFVAVPAALHFLSGFAGDAVTPNLTADSYLSFFLSYIAGLAVLSLVPLLLVFWHWIKPLTPGGLLKSERWVILLSFVAAAIITPTPDAANQTMIAGPVILLYQLGVIAVLISIFRGKRAARNTDNIFQLIDTSAELFLSDPDIETQPTPVITPSTLPSSDTAIPFQSAVTAAHTHTDDVINTSKSRSTPLETSSRQSERLLTSTSSTQQSSIGRHRTMDIARRKVANDVPSVPTKRIVTNRPSFSDIARPKLSFESLTHAQAA